LMGKVSVNDINDANSAGGKNLRPACNSPVGDLAHLDSDAEDLSPIHVTLHNVTICPFLQRRTVYFHATQ
jgi:hypothetical protein